MKVRLRQPVSTFRVLLGAVITVLGIYVLREWSEAFGLILFLLGLTIGVRGSASVIITTIIAGAYLSLIVLFLFLTTPHTDGWSIGEWLQEHWLKVALYSAFFGALLVSHHRTRQTCWDALYADYSEVPQWNPNTENYPIRNGLLVIDEEHFEISSVATEIGLILARPDGQSLFFSWDRVVEIRVRNEAPSRANIEVRRRIPVPLLFEIPWSRDFKDWVPPDVQTYGV